MQRTPHKTAGFSSTHIASLVVKLLAAVPLLAALSLPTAGATTIAQLEARAEKDASTPAGQSYQASATRAFWSDIAFMKECAPPGTQNIAAFSIFVEILADGKMGQLQFNPSTPVAQCIAANVKGRQFPAPPADFVLRIDLRFR